MRLFTSHWRSPLLADVAAVPVSISRGEPRFPVPFRYRRARWLAPSNETWAQEDREEFEASYIRQLEELGAERIVADLERIAGDGAAALMCWEKPGEFCHRRLLAAHIEKETGQEVPELEPGMLPQREDVAQRSLF